MIGARTGLALLALIISATAAQAASYKAEIRRTAYGVPHIKAADFAGLGSVALTFS